MLLHGPMDVGHDSHDHLDYTHYFGEQFWDGELFPHWLLNMNHGLGSPTFFVFPPLPCYVYSLLAPVGNAFQLNAFNTMAFLALFGSGISAFIWIRTMASRGVALATATLYMLMPYHLAIDFYRRTALPECWGLVSMPLVLYFSTQVIGGKRRAVVGLAVAYGLLILSHLVSVVMFSAIPLLVALTMSPAGRRVRSVLSIAGGMLLGIGLACFYFLPALYHSRYFPVSRLGGIGPADNLLHLGRGLFQSRDFIGMLGLNVVETVLFIALCGAVAYRHSRSDQKRQIVLWLSVCIIPIFLMSRFSIRLWEKLPFLLHAVQYPWRLNIVLCVAALPIVAVFLSQISWPPSFPRALSLALMLLLVVTWLISYDVVLKDYSLSRNPVLLDPVSESDGWFSSWSAVGMDSTAAFQASLGPKVRFVSGDGTANVLVWKPRHLEFETYAGNGGSVMINQFYYPEWRAKLAGEDRLIEIKTAMPQGLLEVQVPPGSHKIRMEIPVSSAERLGSWLSGLCVLLCTFWALKPGALKSVAPEN
jgi:hypothetical protein